MNRFLWICNKACMGLCVQCWQEKPIGGSKEKPVLSSVKLCRAFAQGCILPAVKWNFLQHLFFFFFFLWHPTSKDWHTLLFLWSLQCIWYDRALKAEAKTQEKNEEKWFNVSKGAMSKPQDFSKRASNYNRTPRAEGKSGKNKGEKNDTKDFLYATKYDTSITTNSNFFVISQWPQQ